MNAIEAPAPANRLGAPLAWVRKRLFGSVSDALLTVAIGYVIVQALLGVGRWLPATNWSVITDNARFWLVGRIPDGTEWRPAVAAAAFLVYGASFVFLRRRFGGGIAGAVVAAPAVAAIVLMWPVPLASYGGLLLTVTVATFGIVLSFPFGVVVGVGRTSSLPAIRLASAVYTEAIRGVPLIAMIFWFSIFGALVVGPGLGMVEKGILAFVVFTSALIAEITRGGIRAVPFGQREAARGLGLSGPQTLVLIVLPQALRTMIPAIVGQFITLFKDTSLLVIVGLQELTGAGQALLANPAYIRARPEVFTFLPVVYFTFTYAMSLAARRLEVHLGVGKR